MGYQYYHFVIGILFRRAMDNQQQQSPRTSLRSGATQPESDGDNDQFYSGEEDSIDANGDGPRKRQRRPMSVS